jgi:malic enzyme
MSDELWGAVAKRTLETDYLVVGCGAAGMAFADSLIDASRAEIVMVDRRHAQASSTRPTSRGA